MLKSMTGFGRYDWADNDRRISAEMKSVNHRYLDISLKMPKKLNRFEARIRTLLKKKIHRGKVDVYITYEDFSESAVLVKYNKALAGEYMDRLREMADDFQLNPEISPAVLAGFPDVLTAEEQDSDEDEIWNLLSHVLTETIDRLADAREREGAALKKDLCEKLHHMEGEVDQIEARAPQIVSEYRSRIMKQVQECLQDTQMDESRIAAEVVIYSDKICTDEETVRLRSHIHSMLEVLEKDTEIGRKLDFIAQEMNREANTILSKANDLETSNIAIDLKTEIEKIREQVQNIE